MPDDLLPLALGHHQAGRVTEAERLYREILTTTPDRADAWHLFGLLAHQVGQHATAIDLISRAIQLSPRNAMYFGNLGLAWEAQNKSEQALASYQQALEIDPNFAEAHSNLSVLLLQLNRLPEATSAARRAVQIRPDYAEAHNNLGNIYERQQRWGDAIVAYREALRHRPELAAVHTNLGNVLSHSGRVKEATASYQEALRLQPEYFPAWTFFGNLLRTQGQCAEALEQYDRAIAIQPGDPYAHTNRGLALVELGRLDEAVAAYQQALQLDPQHVEALNNLGKLQARRGDFAGAEQVLRKAVALRPQDARFQNNLGTVLQMQGRLPEALECYQRALANEPTNAEARGNVGAVLSELNRPQEAIAQFEQAQVLQPQNVELLGNLAMLYALTGRADDARRKYDAAQAIHPSDARRLRMALLSAMVYDSAEQIDAERTQLAASIEQLLGAPLKVLDPLHDVGVTPSQLVYQGRDNRELLVSLTQLFRHASPVLNYTAPHVAEPSQSEPAGKRLGIVLPAVLDEPGSIDYALLLDTLPADFQITLFTAGPHGAALQERITARGGELVRLPLHLVSCQRLIAERRLDALVWGRVGPDPLTYFLAFARLAPLQVATVELPQTTGIDTIDRFVSSTPMEPREAAKQYSEQFVKLSSPPRFFAQRSEPTTRTRAEFNLPADAKLYLCGRGLFKIHPEFDALVQRILREDDSARIVFFADAANVWQPLLRQCLERKLGDQGGRLIWLPHHSDADFAAIVSLCDVVLDTPHTNSRTSTSIACALGVPVVTLPAMTRRSRWTAAWLGKLGQKELIARTGAEYVRIAIRAANDRAWHDELSEKLIAAVAALPSEDQFTLDFAQWLQDAVK